MLKKEFEVILKGERDASVTMRLFTGNLFSLFMNQEQVFDLIGQVLRRLQTDHFGVQGARAAGHDEFMFKFLGSLVNQGQEKRKFFEFPSSNFLKVYESWYDGQPCTFQIAGLDLSDYGHLMEYLPLEELKSSEASLDMDASKGSLEISIPLSPESDSKNTFLIALHEIHWSYQNCWYITNVNNGADEAKLDLALVLDGEAIKIFSAVASDANEDWEHIFLGMAAYIANEVASVLE